MKHTLIGFTALSSLLFVCAGCSEIPKEAYYAHGQPESLLEKSSDHATFSLSAPHSVSTVMNWLDTANPKDATLRCQETSKNCNKLERLLVKKGITVTRTMARSNQVIFTYTTVKARDCENRYIDNMINPYNLNYPTLGCSVAANSVQMVTNRKDFVDPNLSDLPDARKSRQVIDQYNAPSKATTDFTALVSGSSGSSSR